MQDGDFELVTLKNGARAVRHRGHGEVMHPAGGPWTEANRLYVEQPRLAERLSRRAPLPLCIYDVGLGAATNAVAALTCARGLDAAIEIHSFELDLAPLRLALGDPQGFPFLQPFADAAQALLRDGQWQEGGRRWQLHQGDLRERLQDAPPRAELIFFDPFSPQHNSALWTQQSFAALRARCRSDGDGALLLTYSAATPTRVSLLLGGFFVGAGLSTGTKGETTVGATQLAALEQPLAQRWLERWQRSSARAPVGKLELSASDEAALRRHPQFADFTPPL